ncbi:MAG: hypothetical protein Q8P18_26020 [Pseudomonadota bacterium]|nr:hypothetical protein [Pseudomonadota bacterium]
MNPVVAAWIVGCHSAEVEAPEAVAGVADSVASLGAVSALTRASLDLRGVRPTLSEIEAAEAAGETLSGGDPAAWLETVDTFLQDPRFGPRVRDMFAGIYLTRQDSYLYGADDYGLVDPAAFVAAVGDEPLRVLSTLAEQDLPYTDIVTADWTMADASLAAAAPVDYPDGATGWQQVRYTDGRPAAGILATNGFWWHYATSTSNLNRGRANAISRVLLCFDYLSQPVEFDRSVDLLDADAVADAVRTNPACLSCHATLDPLASYLYGFFPVPGDTAADASTWHAERTAFWRRATGVAPAYYGAPGESLGDLGLQIAADPRLTGCVTEQVYGLLHGREPDVDDTAALLSHRDDMLAGGGTLRALFASVAGADAYRLGADSADVDDEGYAPKMLSVEQLGTVLEDLTGFRFTYQGYDLLGSDAYGVRTLAGGADGIYSIRPGSSPSATGVLVHERLAEAAAWYVAAQDHEHPGDARLFTEIDFTEIPSTGRSAMAEQLRALRLRLFGVRVDIDGPEVTADLALWAELYAVDGDPVAAWAGVLSVLLRDPAFLFY